MKYLLLADLLLLTALLILYILAPPLPLQRGGGTDMLPTWVDAARESTESSAVRDSDPASDTASGGTSSPDTASDVPSSATDTAEPTTDVPASDTAQVPDDPPGAMIISVPYLSQGEEYPNGCESVTAVMALRYWGFSVSTDEFIDRYLDTADAPVVDGIGPDPDLFYCGNPRLPSGWGCYSPVICNALNRIVPANSFSVSQFYGMSLEELCTTYIDQGIPVIIWATVGMDGSRAKANYAMWETEDGKRILYHKRLHCLLLVGYDNENYYFNDPLREGKDGRAYVAYSKAKTERAYQILNQQCVVIVPVENGSGKPARDPLAGPV